jgi:hypothetical protein
VGFTIFGVGGIVGCVTALSGLGVTCNNWDNSACAQQAMRRFVIGLVVIAASAVVGLPIGIPGAIRMVRASEEERVAIGCSKGISRHELRQCAAAGFVRSTAARRSAGVPEPRAMLRLTRLLAAGQGVDPGQFADVR